ncbi:hypothetical protein, partial [Caulobacter sp. 17J65-9]|uniref:hypothetical protein n=1 Tax=Caulobacter sp. 17J65-9 TaxID=2709382 RepID=UPI0013C7F12A
MRKAWTGGALALVGAVAAGAAIAQQKPGTPTATYWVTADTYVGASGGMSSALAMMSGGAPSASVQRVLNLQLSSIQAPTGAPAADHLPPAGLKAGARLPLISPKLAPAAGDAGSAGAVRGRVLVYWGCGEQARPGQPTVIDLAKPGAG